MINSARKRTGKIILAFFAMLIALALVEGILRFKGYQPGFKVYTRFFKQVDSLFILDGYYTDSNCIMRVSQEAREFICNELKTNTSPSAIQRIISRLASRQSKEVYKLIEDFMEINTASYVNTFKMFLGRIYLSSDESERELGEAIKSYAKCPINSDGFKSIEFRKYNTQRKSILLLGDSFTWGNSAKNKTDCFADLLLTKGYVVYNSAIIGADPTQYLQTAKVLVQILKPDYVVANFYMGNDVYYFERKPLPYKPAFYSTNAGYLLSCPEGVYFKDEREAYQHSVDFFTIPSDKNLFNKLCAKTVITSLLWSSLAKRELVNTESGFRGVYNTGNVAYYSEPYSNVQLKEIKEISELNAATFILVAIPAVREGKLLLPEDVPGLFDGIKYFVPPVTKQHYVKRVDGHYNDMGHAIHASFVDSLIRNFN